MTYQISRGQQYDRAGATVVFGHLVAQYKADGSYDAGDMPFNAPSGLGAAILRVIATGMDETVQAGGHGVEVAGTDDRVTPPCPRCGTYCDGDCEANT